MLSSLTVVEGCTKQWRPKAWIFWSSSVGFRFHMNENKNYCHKILSGVRWSIKHSFLFTFSNDLALNGTWIVWPIADSLFWWFQKKFPLGFRKNFFFVRYCPTYFFIFSQIFLLLRIMFAFIPLMNSVFCVTKYLFERSGWSSRRILFRAPWLRKVPYICK